MLYCGCVSLDESSDMSIIHFWAKICFTIFDEDEDDIAFTAKNIKKILKFRKNKKFGNNRTTINHHRQFLNAKCHKKGLMKKDCPFRKKDRNKYKSKSGRYKKKQAFLVTWDD